MIWNHQFNPFLLGPWEIGPLQLAGVELGPFHPGIRWYSLPYVLGFLAIYAALFRAVVRRRIPNANLDRLEEACLLMIASIIVGGRVGYFVLNEPRTLTTWQGWLEVPQVWRGGMAFFGAAVALFAAEFLYCRKYRLGFWHGADRIMWILAIALGFGRVANFINGELYGIPTNGQWGVIFAVGAADLVNGVNVPRHPVQLYSAVSHWLLGLVILWKLRTPPRSEFDRVPGYTVFWFLAGYGVLRFVTDFWRQESVYLGPINGGQALSLGLVLAGLGLARLRYHQIRARGTALDYYPPDGVDADLPAEAHAWLASQEAGPPAEPPVARPQQARGAKRRRK